ncbi:MAG: glycosyltransferase family 2 protein [Gammaproteobacteria bacterium]|nr:glycosyltransferase family 2 protein [Gammaproteobacteria bacterium]
MKPCVIIPVYNHGETMESTLEKLAGYSLHTFVVDDGSGNRTKEILRRLDADSDVEFELITLAENQGKGAAVQAGFRRASEQGYTHAVQVDADGQHDLGDLGVLLDEAWKNPVALISGNPQFDESAPASRVYGRWITTFWVWVETLSLSIPDAMCGFRVYPLEPCMRLLDSRKISSRMEFDIEIAVRLYWRDVPFVAVPTRVIYPDKGTSHFRVLQDNWRITRMHTILFFGMLLRSPVLIMRKLGVRKRHWSKLEERGGTLGMKILFAGYKLFGRGVFRVMLFPVMSYFFLTSASARRASRQYLDRVQATREKVAGEPAKRLNSFRHFLQFGESILDKTAQWAGVRSKENIRYISPEIYEEIINSERGGVFIGSHLGNLEALRAFGGLKQGLTVNALVFTRHSLKFMRFLEEANPQAVENIIQVDTLGPESVIRMQSKIAAREWIAMVGDRTSVAHAGRSVTCDFLGHPAQFAEGPFILASLLDCPVYFLFCLKKDRKYEVYLEKLADKLELPRATRKQDLERVIRRYAALLEEHCLAFPYQWYNFFDFWQEPHTE